MENKIKLLMELGEPPQWGKWPDYLQYGLSDADVADLIGMATDPALHQAPGDSKAVWAPLHAWRALGQIGSEAAIQPLISLFDSLCDDDWALSELSKVMGMIGPAAIASLADYMNDASHEEFARAMASDGLAEIAKQQPESRDRVLQCFRDYMTRPDETAADLNGMLIANLMDLDARELIDDIRRLFEKGCVDITCAGDLEDVEMGLGLRASRSTPKPHYGKLPGLNVPPEMEKPASDDILNLIDFYLMRYGHDDAILDVSEMDGFFAALACAPDMILPSRWFPAIWGGEELEPEWENETEFTEFSHAVFALYNQVMQHMGDDRFEALFLERKVEGKTYTIVDEWCDGFMRGLELWPPLSSEDKAFTEECIRSVRLFSLEGGLDEHSDLDEAETTALQQSIEPSVRCLHQYFLARRPLPGQPHVRGAPKTGRNDPCPCGSGKKFKKCCLH